LLPYLLAHELIHFQQEEMKNDTTTLSYVIRKGMADFIGELISGAMVVLSRLLLTIYQIRDIG
jgi:hypothetical protein